MKISSKPDLPVEVTERMKGPSRKYFLVVETRHQLLTVWRGSRCLARYRVSTARKGLGTRAGSNRTPTGWHEIAGRIGKGKRIGSVFVSRRFTGEVVPRSRWRSGDEQDLILTRILRLRGLEPGHNAGPGVDSYSRYIYLHGTNHEHLLGRPASHGCIRMANDDIAELFRLIQGRPAWCWIGKTTLCTKKTPRRSATSTCT